MKFKKSSFLKPLAIFSLAMSLSAALAGTAPLALASGSSSVGGAKTGSSASYQKGKRIYKKKLACDGCSMDGKKLNKDSAMMLLHKGVKEELSDAEKHDLGVYLKRRYKIKH